MTRLIVAAFCISFVVTLAEAQSKKPEPFKLTAEEQQILDRVNEERVKEKLKPLRANERLTKAARAYSEVMAKHDKMDHQLDGQSPLDRVKKSGYAFLLAAENLGWGYKDGDTLVTKWMESDYHKKNILTPRFLDTGIGIARTEAGKPYYTQLFGAPKSLRQP